MATLRHFDRKYFSLAALIQALCKAQTCALHELILSLRSSQARARLKLKQAVSQNGNWQ